MPLFPPHLTDLTLIVGQDNKQKSFPVIKATLRSHSPAFDAMYNNAWHELDQSTLHLPEDDADAFEVILNIMQHKLTSYSLSPSPQVLLQVAQLADKYDFVALVNPCIMTWMSGFNDDTFTADEECYIFWILGMRNFFLAAWHKLINVSILEENDYEMPRWFVHRQEVMTGQRVPWQRTYPMKVDLLPDGFLPSLFDAAQNRLHALHKKVQCFALSQMKHPRPCQVMGNTHKVCENAFTGGLVRTLIDNRIPIKGSGEEILAAEPPEWTDRSIMWVASQLAEDGSFAHVMKGHQKCVPLEEWKCGIEKIVNEFPELPEEMEAHFAQARFQI